ncbi:MAG: hypothetical protein R2839_09240 [Thermomicrobiales bacterium]
MTGHLYFGACAGRLENEQRRRLLGMRQRRFFTTSSIGSPDRGPL